MKEGIDRSVWINYFNEFTRRNQSRPTRLEVFGEMGAQEEERGLPFAGISLERGNGMPAVEIMFGARNGGAPRHLTRVIENVREITPKRGLDGRDEALEIVDSHGEKNLLTFRPADGSGGQPEWSWCKSPFEFLSSINLPPPPVPVTASRSLTENAANEFESKPDYSTNNWFIVSRNGTRTHHRGY